MTIARITQAGNEVWHAGAAKVRFTQLGGEVWLAYPSRLRVTQLALEVWRSVSSAVAASASQSGGHKSIRWRRAKQAPQFQAAAKRHRTEVTSILGADSTVALGGPTKHAHGVFFKRKPSRRPKNWRHLASFVADAAAILGGVSKATRHERFFLKHAPARRPINHRIKAALVLDARALLGGSHRGSHFRFFLKHSARRPHDLRRRAAPVTVRLLPFNGRSRELYYPERSNFRYGQVNRRIKGAPVDYYSESVVSIVT